MTLIFVFCTRNCIFQQRHFGLQKTGIVVTKKHFHATKTCWKQNYNWIFVSRTNPNDVSFVLIKMRWFKIYIGWEFDVNYSSFEKEKREIHLIPWWFVNTQHKHTQWQTGIKALSADGKVKHGMQFATRNKSTRFEKWEPHK